MTRAIRGARIFDGRTWHDKAALLFSDGSVAAILPATAIPADADVVSADGGVLDRKCTRLNSSRSCASRMPSSACQKTTTLHTAHISYTDPTAQISLQTKYAK